MAVNQTLRYYRGQFNPEQAYQSNGSDNNNIISMYDPQGLDQFIDATAKRQERFDIAQMAQAQEIARIGELETYDLSELNKRLQAFESGINSLVKDKYNGDYSAAANEISRQIGTERTNPFYHFNKQKVEMGKSYLDAKMKLGANFIESESPFDVDFKSWQQGKTFEFTPINKEDIVQAATLVGQNFSKMVTSDSGLQLSPEGQYFKNITQYGIKDLNQLDEFIEKSGIDQQIYDSMPELSKAKDQVAVRNAIRQGLTSAIGTTDTKYVANQGYLSDLEEARMKKLQGGTSMGTGKLVSLGSILGPDNKTMVPLHGINYGFGTTASENNEIKANVEQINNIINKSTQTSDIVGSTEKDSKLLKDLASKELRAFAFVPTTDQNNPFELRMQILGTPLKTKNNTSPTPVEIDAKFSPNAVEDQANLVVFLSKLDSRVLNTYLTQLKEINPQGYINFTNRFGIKTK